MKYVLDSSVEIKRVLPELDSDKAVSLLDDYVNQVHELMAPDCFPIEVAHTLTKAERRKVIAVGDAVHKLLQLMSAPPILLPYLPLLRRAVEISSQKRIGVYDCLYVALAEAEGCQLVTADTRLIANLPGFPIVSLASLP